MYTDHSMTSLIHTMSRIGTLNNFKSVIMTRLGEIYEIAFAYENGNSIIVPIADKLIASALDRDVVGRAIRFYAKNLINGSIFEDDFTSCYGLTIDVETIDALDARDLGGLAYAFKTIERKLPLTAKLINLAPYFSDDRFTMQQTSAALSVGSLEGMAFVRLPKAAVFGADNAFFWAPTVKDAFKLYSTIVRCKVNVMTHKGDYDSAIDLRESMIDSCTATRLATAGSIDFLDPIRN